jgi:signal transduction histidine kinase
LPTDPLSLFGLAVVGLLVLTLMLLNQRKKRIISTKTQALAETEAGYRLLFEHSPMPLVEEDLSAVRVLLDNLQSGGVSDLVAHFRTHPGDLALCAEEARIVAANRATLALYGAGEPGLLTRLATILPDDPGEGYAAELAGLHRAGRSETRTHSRTLDGLPLLVERRAVVAAGHEQDWAKVFVTIIDLTEQERLKQQHKEFERQLEQTRKLEAIGSLAGGIAHDFNNLLAPILGRAELLSAEKGDDPIVAEHSRAIVDASRRARALVRQILTFSRQVDQEIVPVSLAAVVTEVVDLLRPTLAANIEVDFHPPDPCPRVMADPTQLHQVVMNLAANACHAMEQGGGRLSLHRWCWAWTTWTTGRCRPGRTCGWWWRTPAPAWTRPPWRASSTPISPPGRSARAPAWACRWCSASCATAAASCGSRANPAGARCSASTSRWWR